MPIAGEKEVYADRSGGRGAPGRGEACAVFDVAFSVFKIYIIVDVLFLLFVVIFDLCVDVPLPPRAKLYCPGPRPPKLRKPWKTLENPGKFRWKS